MILDSAEKRDGKIINFYSCGDSTDVKTWSNVPYLFACELEQRGFKLNRINIEPNKRINRWFNRFSYLIYQRIFKRNACPVFARTSLHRYLIHHKLRKTAKKYDAEASFNLFLSYAFRNQYSKLPSVLWCDWSDAIVIERIGRKVKFYEKQALQYETNVIRNADVVYSMFPICARQMSDIYRREVRYLGGNVVNSLYDGHVDLHTLIKRHEKSDSILMIGNYRYLSGARRLIEAVSDMRDNGTNMYVDIIGMNRNLIPDAPVWVRFHGYLDKGDVQQRDKYYKLIFDSRMLVNITTGWSGYSSIIEAMYYATPVIVYPFSDFVEEFDSDINFGAYCKETDNLSHKILEINNSTNYAKMCENSSKRVSSYTWHNYIDKFLKDISNIGISV